MNYLDKPEVCGATFQLGPLENPNRSNRPFHMGDDIKPCCSHLKYNIVSFIYATEGVI